MNRKHVKRISQADARALKLRVEELEGYIKREHSAWSQDYPGGISIAQTPHTAPTDFLPAIIRTSRQLGHAVVCTCDDKGVVYYFALPAPPQEKANAE